MVAYSVATRSRTGRVPGGGRGGSQKSGFDVSARREWAKHLLSTISSCLVGHTSLNLFVPLCLVSGPCCRAVATQAAQHNRESEGVRLLFEKEAVSFSSRGGLCVCMIAQGHWQGGGGGSIALTA